MHHLLIWITLILSYQSFTKGEARLDWDKELDDINSKLDEILKKLRDSVGEVDKKTDALNQKLDRISNEVEDQKSIMIYIKKSVVEFSGHCSGGKEEIAKVMKKIDGYGQKQLRDQQSIRDDITSQKLQLVEFKNLTITGFSKTLEKLISVNNGARKLEAVFMQQDTKVNAIQDTLQKSIDSIDRSRESNIAEMEEAWKNISITLKEQSRPLSSGAESHVKRAVSVTNSIVDGMNQLKDLEPKLIHVVRLSENIQKGLVDNDLSPVANNLTNSLNALKITTPIIVSSTSKTVKELEAVLSSLKSMSKTHNDCLIDISAEIRDHHNIVITYLNETKVDKKAIQDMNDKVWNEIMKKLENIESGSETNTGVYDRLIKLRENLEDIRKTLRDHFDESEPDDDVVFG